MRREITRNISYDIKEISATIDRPQEVSRSFSSEHVDALRRRGRAAVEIEDPDAAEDAYMALLGIDPTDIYALIGLGLVCRLRGKRDDALRQFREAARIWPVHSWPLLEISAELANLNLLNDAVDILQQALQNNPQHYFILLALGRLYRQQGDLERAKTFFQRAVNVGGMQAPDRAEARTELAQLLDKPERSNEAPASPALEEATTLAAEESQQKDEITLPIPQVFFETLISPTADQSIFSDGTARSEKINLLLDAGRSAREQGNRPGAIILFEQALALDEENIDLLCELADLYHTEKRLQDAVTFYRRVLAKQTTNLVVIGRLAVIMRELRNYTDALELIQEAYLVDPQNQWIKYEHALTLRDAGQNDDAVVILESIDSGSPMYFWSQMTLGHLARAMGRHTWAIVCFEQAANAAANPVEALHEIVKSTRLIGDVAAAQGVISRIFALDPNSYHGHMADAFIKRDMGDFVGARDAFLQAAVIMPMEAQPYLEIAQEERRRGDFKAANEAIDAALRVGSLQEGALLSKAKFLAETGDIDGALKVYEILRDEWPTSVRGYLDAAQLLFERGDVEATNNLFAAARKACTANVEIDLREAEIIRRQGRLDEAFARLTLAHARYPNELWAWFARGSAAVDLGFFDIAEALLSAPPSVASNEKGRIHSLWAQLNKARWSLEAAIQNLDATIAADPEDSLAVYERAKLKLITFDFTGARSDLVSYSKLQILPARLQGRSANPSQSPVGQFYEEFVFDKNLVDRLESVRGYSSDKRVSYIPELVRSYPDSTGPAIGLFIALRRSGRLDHHVLPGMRECRIPQRITQYWSDSVLPKDIREFMDSWASSNPNFKIEIFDDSSARTYLRNHVGPTALQAFERAAEPAQRADLFRLARLFKEGGYYVDADDLARGSIVAHVPPKAEFFAYQEDLGSIGNNVLGVVQNHPAIGLALQGAVASILRGDRDIVWLSTGPGLLTRSLATWIAADPSTMDQRIAGIAILTISEMRRVAAMFCHAAYKSTHRAWLNRAFPKHGKVVLDKK